jgi:hypothetical protein
VTPLERLRQAAELLPPGAAVTLPREALLEALGGPPDVATPATPAGDLTVAEVAAQLRRKPSTIRGWLEAGRFTGAYHLPASGKLSVPKEPGIKPQPKVGAWRVPQSAIDAFLEPLRHPTSQGVDLSAWRRHRRSQ